MFEGAEIISRYTRAQAIEDGVLVDVSGDDGASGFKVPVAISCALSSELRIGAGREEATFQARLRDVCNLFAIAGRRSDRGGHGPDVFFRVKVGRRVLSLWGSIGGGDDGEPVLTVGFPEDR